MRSLAWWGSSERDSIEKNEPTAPRNYVRLKCLPYVGLHGAPDGDTFFTVDRSPRQRRFS